MGVNLVKTVGLCQVNDIIPAICRVNDILEYIHGAERLKEIHDTNSDAVSMPSLAYMQEVLQKKGRRKKGYEVSNMKRYLLVSSLHDRGMGCGGTSPLLAPIAVYLVEEEGSKSGGIFQKLNTAYNKFRELPRDYFDREGDKEPLRSSNAQFE